MALDLNGNTNPLLSIILYDSCYERKTSKALAVYIVFFYYKSFTFSFRYILFIYLKFYLFLLDTFVEDIIFLDTLVQNIFQAK